jgi:hypothetical protein
VEQEAEVAGFRSFSIYIRSKSLVAEGMEELQLQ